VIGNGEQITSRRVSSEDDLSSHGFVRDVSIERWKALKVVARLLSRLRPQCGIEIARVGKHHLRKEEGIASSDGKRVGPLGRSVKDNGADVGKSTQKVGVTGLVVRAERVGINRGAAISDEV
jgi:hypothetical protein